MLFYTKFVVILPPIFKLIIIKLEEAKNSKIY